MSCEEKQILIIFLSSILLAFSGIAYAQDEDDQEDADAPLLQAVTVVEQGRRADTVTVIDREEIDNKHSAVAYDVLENQPGLNVVRRLGFTGSGLSRLTIRGNGGVGPAGLQVFVDGRPDATVSFAHPTPSALTLENVERIEVIHGPSPVLYGSGKTGVVNIVTGKPEPGSRGFIEVSGGSFDTTENFSRWSYAGERIYGRVSASYRRTKGDNPNSEALAKNINFKGGFDFTRHLNATLSFGKNEDSFDVYREFFVPGPFTDPRTDSLDLIQTVVDATLNAEFGNVKSSLKFFYDELEPRSQVLDPSEERADVHERGLRFKTSWSVLDSTTLIGGVDYLRAEANNSPVPPVPPQNPRFTMPADRVTNTLRDTGIYGFIEHTFSQAVSISGGLRHTDHSEFGNELSGEVGLLWTPVQGDVNNPLYDTTFRVRATRGFQAPTLQQLFGVFRAGEGGPANPDLEPEIVEQYEIGFNKPFSRANIDVVFYVQDGDGLIESPAPAPPPPPDIRNNIDYVNRGVEAKLHFFPTEDWKMMLGTSLADFDNDDGNRFLRAPEKTFDFGITRYYEFLRPRDFSISLNGSYAQDTFDVPTGSPRVKLDDYFVADVKMNYHVTERAKIFFEIDNVTDSNYELVNDIPAPSFSVFAGIRLDY